MRRNFILAALFLGLAPAANAAVTAQPFNFMGVAIDEPIDQAAKSHSFTKCTMSDHPNIEAWGAVLDPETVLMLYGVAGKVAAMEYFFTSDRAHALADKLTS